MIINNKIISDVIFWAADLKKPGNGGFAISLSGMRKAWWYRERPICIHQIEQSILAKNKYKYQVDVDYVHDAYRPSMIPWSVEEIQKIRNILIKYYNDNK